MLRAILRHCGTFGFEPLHAGIALPASTPDVWAVLLADEAEVSDRLSEPAATVPARPKAVLAGRVGTNQASAIGISVL